MLKWLLPIFGLWTFQIIATENHASAPPSMYAGTYAIRFCQGPCTATMYRTGTLILFDRPLRDMQGRARSKWLEQGRINGCLLLDPVHGSSAGWMFNPRLAARRFIVWSVGSDGSVRLQPDRTVDAGYLAVLRRTRSGLGGTGMFWSAMDSPPTPPTPKQDEIQARRMGDAYPTRCPRFGVDADAMEDVLTP